MRQVYHLNQYARDINYNFSKFNNIINFLNGDIINRGSSVIRSFIYPYNSIKMFDYMINEFSLIGAYGDVYIALGYLCIIGGLAALGVKNIKVKKH